MHRVLVLGAGKIGSLVACLLSESGDYEVSLGDISFDASKRIVEDLGLSRVTPLLLDVRHPDAISAYVTTHRFDAVLSSLPYFCNPVVAGLAREHRLHYFDLTEDVEVTNQVKVLSTDSPQAFVPQCGLAPGFISIAAHDLITHFDTVDTVKMRVGALPVHPSNALKYSQIGRAHV